MPKSVFPKVEFHHTFVPTNVKKPIMKKVLNTVLMFCLLSASTLTASYAAADINKRAMIVLENVKDGQTLTLVSDLGEILYKEEITQTGRYVKNFDLASLPKGHYQFELEKDFEIKVIPVTVMNDDVLLETEKATIVYKPVVRVKEEIVYVSKLSLDHEPMTVKLYYEDSMAKNNYELIFAETLRNEDVLDRAYKLSKKEKGNYRVVISTGDRTFTEYIKI